MIAAAGAGAYGHLERLNCHVYMADQCTCRRKLRASISKVFEMAADGFAHRNYDLLDGFTC